MKKRKILTIVIILIILFSTISLTLGKYIYNSVWVYYISSRGFYFESDKLDINTKKNSILKWEGENLEFELKNSSNSGLISEDDITYKITCEVLGDEFDYVECVLNGTESNVYTGTLATVSYCKNSKDSMDVSALEKAECEIQGYTWYNETTSKTNYFNLNLIDDTKKIDEVAVKITAESLTPYSKKIVGIYNLNKLEKKETNLIINYQNYVEYDELILTNLSNEQKCVEIIFDSNNYIIDLNDNIVDYSLENNKINKITIGIPEKNSVINQFYKINFEKEYSISDSIITEKEC